MSYLPLAHMLERQASMMAFLAGGRLGFMSGDITTLLSKLISIANTKTNMFSCFVKYVLFFKMTFKSLSQLVTKFLTILILKKKINSDSIKKKIYQWCPGKYIESYRIEKNQLQESII